jgi:hypothetical protein
MRKKIQMWLKSKKLWSRFAVSSRKERQKSVLLWVKDEPKVLIHDHRRESFGKWVHQAQRLKNNYARHKMGKGSTCLRRTPAFEGECVTFSGVAHPNTSLPARPRARPHRPSLAPDTRAHTRRSCGPEIKQRWQRRRTGAALRGAAKRNSKALGVLSFCTLQGVTRSPAQSPTLGLRHASSSRACRSCGKGRWLCTLWEAHSADLRRRRRWPSRLALGTHLSFLCSLNSGTKGHSKRPSLPGLCPIPRHSRGIFQGTQLPATAVEVAVAGTGEHTVRRQEEDGEEKEEKKPAALAINSDYSNRCRCRGRKRCQPQPKRHPRLPKWACVGVCASLVVRLNDSGVLRRWSSYQVLRVPRRLRKGLVWYWEVL